MQKYYFIDNIYLKLLIFYQKNPFLVQKLLVWAQGCHLEILLFFQVFPYRCQTEIVLLDQHRSKRPKDVYVCGPK